MASDQLDQRVTGEQLEATISKALKKVGGTKENDLCRYLPGEGGGYLHHFTLRKMKSVNPVKLSEMIGQHILNADHPSTFAPKQRMPRSSRKRQGAVILDRALAEQIVQMAREAGNFEVVAQLSPPKSLNQCRKDLIQSIRAGRVEQKLWDQYCEAAAQTASTR